MLTTLQGEFRRLVNAAIVKSLAKDVDLPCLVEDLVDQLAEAAKNAGAWESSSVNC